MKPKIISLLVVFNVVIRISVYSQDSLLTYLEISARNNPTVLQKFDEYQAALQKIPQAGSLPDPQFNAGVLFKPMELVNGNQVAQLQLMQMFPWFGVLKNSKDEMSLMAKAKYESFRDARTQVFYDVQRTWYEMQKIRQNIRISEKNLEILHTLERLSLVKFKSGPLNGNSSSPSVVSNSYSLQNTTAGSSGIQSMGGNSGNVASNSSSSSMQSAPMSSSTGGSGLADLYRIQIEIGELENNVALLKSQLNTVNTRFNSFLNRPPISAVSLPDSIRTDTLAIPLSAISDSMLNNNPMLGMLQYEQQSLEAREKMVSRMGYPMVGLGLNYTLINKSEMSTSPMNGKDMIMPMVTVTLPIYRKKYKAMQAEAGYLKSATEQGLQATSNTLQTDYYEALQLYQDAQRRMKLYDNQTMLAKKSLDIMIKSFSTSGSGLTDILQIQQQLLNYEFKITEAVTDNNTSIAWLKRLMAFIQI